ncbi:MAG TPA: hypothetical protein VFZ97_14435 [Acidimicrobiales bacterium]
MLFEWFDDWAHDHVGVTLTLVSGSREDDLRRAFNAGSFLEEPLTWLQAANIPAGRPDSEVQLSPQSIEMLKWIGRTPDDVRAVNPKPIQGYVRVTTSNGWTVGVEASTTRGADQAVLTALSTVQHRTLSYAKTPGISPLQYAEDGVVICGIDTVVPTQGWGTDREFFSNLALRLLDQQPDVFAPAVVAELLDRWLDLRISPEVLEGPLRAAPMTE